jgi:hypothetical protein
LRSHLLLLLFALREGEQRAGGMIDFNKICSADYNRVTDRALTLAQQVNLTSEIGAIAKRKGRRNG